MEFHRFRDTDLSAVLDGAAVWRRYADRLYEYDERLDVQVQGPIRQAGWEGAAAESSRMVSDRVGQWCETRAMRADAMADVLDQVYDRLSSLQTDLRAIVDAATAAGFTVRDDGIVLAPGVAPVTPGVAGPYTVTATSAWSYTTAITNLLNQVEQVSASAMTAVADLAPESPGRVSPNEYNDIRDDSHDTGITDGLRCPPDDWSPEQNAEWWASLSESDQRAYMMTYPEVVGAMDGLPVVVRDERTGGTSGGTSRWGTIPTTPSSSGSPSRAATTCRRTSGSTSSGTSRRGRTGRRTRR